MNKLDKKTSENNKSVSNRSNKMKTKFTGGIDIALKLPPHQFEETVIFYRDVIGLNKLQKKAQQ